MSSAEFSPGSDRYQDEQYLLANPTWHLEDADFKSAGVISLLQRHGLSSVKRLADVGCGAGKVAHTLAQQLPAVGAVHGFDVSPQASEFWARFQHPRLQFHTADFLADDELYDVVTLLDVFEHVPDYMGFLKALSRKAVHVVFNIPLDMNVVSMLTGQHSAARARYGHLHYFSRETALLTLADCGFEVLADELRPGFLAAPSTRRSPKQRAVDLPRRLLHRLAPQTCATWLGGLSLLVLARTRQHGERP
jgi:SAM-dependent methyltransferase